MGAEPFVQSQQRVRVFPNLSDGPLRSRGRGDSRRNGKEKHAPFPGRRNRCGTQLLSPHEGLATRQDAPRSPRAPADPARQLSRALPPRARAEAWRRHRRSPEASGPAALPGTAARRTPGRGSPRAPAPLLSDETEPNPSASYKLATELRPIASGSSMFNPCE